MSHLTPTLAAPAMAQFPIANILVTLPFGFSEDSPVERLPHWQLVVELLPPRDAAAEFYTLKEIAPLLGRIDAAQLSSHAQALWPDWEGYYRLNYSQAVSLIRRYCLVGRRLHPRADLERQVRELRARRQPIVRQEVCQ